MQYIKFHKKNGISYTVDENHILVMKLKNVELIYWCDKRQRYKVRYMQNLKVTDAIFSYKKTKISKIASEDDKILLFNNATMFLVNKRNEPGYNKLNDIIKISVKDYLSLPTYCRIYIYGLRQEINYLEKHVDLDPYMLGLWLGDGTTTEPAITNIDDVIINYIYQYTDNNNLRITVKSDITYYLAGNNRRNIFLTYLRQYNLLGNKHIPLDYMLNTREIRLQVLAGLLDTDGYYDIKGNCYEITQKSDVLAIDIQTLAHSLGFKTFYKKINKYCTYKGKRVDGVYNTIYIYGNCIYNIPCKTIRKQARRDGKDINHCLNKITITKEPDNLITNIEIENDSDYFGIDYTVLH